jgi:hypothetical protein
MYCNFIEYQGVVVPVDVHVLMNKNELRGIYEQSLAFLLGIA